ncbi:MAG: OmpA family protein [Saprospiraceae bacterium]|nr:OmpA family protein [Saprospiraceae bacterium]
MKNTISCLLVILLFQTAGAQTPQPWEIGLGAGAAVYWGETNQIQFGKKIYSINPSLSIHGRKNLSNTLSLRANLTFTQLSGDDQHFTEPAWKKERGLSFSGNLYEASLLAEFYPIGMYSSPKRKSRSARKKRRAFTPFLTIGAGIHFARANVDWNEQQPNDYLNPTLANVDKGHTPKPDISIPFGLGGRFRAGEHFTIGFEALMTPTLGDYLDGISVAGSPDNNDGYLYAGLTGSYAFGNTQKKPRPESAQPQVAAKPAEPDRDNDGIPDIYDQCPDGPGTLQLFGCPDRDDDTVADRDDNCPDEKGHPSLNGCPDQDEDGIADKDDNCPDTKGTLEYRGCPPVDRDKDGVADAEDLCPDMKGHLRWKGCPDSDADGLPDNKDACPGIAGPERLKGCPDSDGDGIADKEDECPSLAGKPEKNGCPEALPPAPGVPFKAVYFGSTLDDWYNTSIVTLDEVVAILQADSRLEARLEGHTDDTGQEPANGLLSEKRAKRCRDYLITKGIDPKRLSYLGHGSNKPFVPNDSRANRQLNRRVEIHFLLK